MINRVLIRIKVVQLLYSYFLTRSEFKIESAPESPASRDKRYAHTLYLDMLLLLLELGGIKVGQRELPLAMSKLGTDKHLKGNRMATALASDNNLHAVVMRGNSNIADFDDVAPGLYEAILKSAAYRSYSKLQERNLKEDVAFWVTVLKTMVKDNPQVIEAARRNPDFTMVGFEQGVDKVIDTLENFSDNRMLLPGARKALKDSLDKAYELYHSLLLLSVEITRMQERRLDAARHKYLPTPEDLNPNMKLVDNPLPRLLAENPDMQAYLKDNKGASWADDEMLIRSFLDAILRSKIYQDYIAKETTTFAEDIDFWRSVYRHIILPSDELSEALENKSLYWNDDLQIMGTFTLKTIKQIANTGGEGNVRLLPQYKDEEDARFGEELFKYAVENRETYREYIDRFINEKHWDTERLAFMDIVIMLTAIAELLNFPSIPLAVTLNEYIEIANYYSTPRSGHFINGILYSVITYLKEQGLLSK